jgi:hypothetical protein
VDPEVVQIEHPCMADEALDADGRARLSHDEVEEIVSTVEAPLRLDGPLGPELIRDGAQRPLEVRRHLTGVAARRAARDAIALYQQHVVGRVAQDEEGRSHARNPSAHYGDVGRGVRLERVGRPIIRKLRQPWGPWRLVPVHAGQGAH